MARRYYAAFDAQYANHAMTGLQETLPSYHLVELPDAKHINGDLWQQYQAVRDAPDLQRSHYFEGRYENIYVPEDRLPALAPVLRAARQGAQQFLGRQVDALACGFWINEMGPGHITLPHLHDEDDELVSAVYYVRVPENSGALLLGQGDNRRRIVPREGRFVFFSPQLMHEVTRNNSSAIRLSVGMNFGVRE